MNRYIDAEERIKELTIELEAMRGAANSYKMHNERLTEENERLSTALAEYDHKTQVRISEEYVSAEAYEELREENKSLSKVITDLSKEGQMLLKQREALQCRVNYLNKYDKERDIALHARLISETKANTVREFAEMFKELMGGELASCGFCNAEGYWSVKAVKDNIDRIANEILNKNTEE